MTIVRILKPARRALLKHRSVAPRILAKIKELSIAPATLANNISRLQGRPESRLRVGEYRVLFVWESDDLVIIDIAPRGSIYD